MGFTRWIDLVCGMDVGFTVRYHTAQVGQDVITIVAVLVHGAVETVSLPGLMKGSGREFTLMLELL